MVEPVKPLAPASAATPASPAQPDKIEQAAWAWFNAHIPGSPVAASVDALNHLRARMPDLIKAMKAAL